MLNRLKSFKGESTLKRAAMNLLVKQASDEDVAACKAAFQAIDVDGSGMISSDELRDVLRSKQHINLSDKEIDDIINQMDYQENHKINYSEFLSATLDVEKFLTDEKLEAVFN